MRPMPPGTRVILTSAAPPFVTGDAGEIIAGPPHTQYRESEYIIDMDDPREGHGVAMADHDQLTREQKTHA